MDELTIRKWALHNAVRYEGKASVGAVVGKLISEDPSIKDGLKDLKKDIQRVVDEVNKLGVEAQTEELKKIAPELLERKKEEKKKELPELKNAVRGKVVTRIPPEPSKHAHAGHALSFLINYLYAKKYDGRCVLRFEDTNPETSTQEFLDSMKEDIAWLGIIPDQTIIASNDMEKFHQHAERLIRDNNAYACFCSRERMKKFRFEKKECECRNHGVKENIDAWEKMLAGKYREDEVTLRLKANMKSDNGAMRDPVIFRISHHPHFLHGTQHKAWPLYDFENAIEDALNGVTHVLRSSEFVPRVEVQNFIKKLLKLPLPESVQYGRFNIIGATTKGREIRHLIEDGKLVGWDDPRLVTIKALRRKGVVPEALKAMVYDLGLKAGESNIDFSLIAAHNRKILDPKTKRFFFVQDPVEVEIVGAPEATRELKLHPDHPEMGRRMLKTKDKFYLANDDVKQLQAGRLYRLMECLNFVKTKTGYKYDGDDVGKYKKKGEMIMHWLPEVNNLLHVDVFMPNAEYVHGLGEPALNKLKVGDIVQFERFGFCRLDEKKDDHLVFWFAHK